MKYGAHCYIFTDHWSDGHLDILDTVKQLGADCLKIAIGDDVEFTPRLTRRRAEGLGRSSSLCQKEFAMSARSVTVLDTEP